MSHQLPNMGTSGGAIESTTTATANTVVERDGSGDSSFHAVEASAGLESGGFLIVGSVSKTASFTIDDSDNKGTMYKVSASGGAVTVTLPAAATNAGKIVGVKKTDASSLTNIVTIDGNASETIDGATTLILYGQNQFVVLWCDGSNWQVIGSGGPCAVIAKSAAFTAGTHKHPVLFTLDATSAAFSVTLPAAANVTGVPFRFVKIDSGANAVTLDGNSSETINDSTTNATALAAQFDSVTIMSDGSEWWIVATGD